PKLQGMFIACASAPARPQMVVLTAVLTPRPSQPNLQSQVSTSCHFQNVTADVQPRMVLDLTTPPSAPLVAADPAAFAAIHLQHEPSYVAHDSLGSLALYDAVTVGRTHNHARNRRATQPSVVTSQWVAGATSSVL